jgi:hypothetical protein
MPDSQVLVYVDCERVANVNKTKKVRQFAGLDSYVEYAIICSRMQQNVKKCVICQTEIPN